MTHRDADWLDDALSALDFVYFEGELSAKNITARWHKFRTKGTSSRFADCDCDTLRIRVNVVLAQEWVPQYFVLDTLYHEMLHAALGAEHDHAFKLSEMRFVHHAKAAVWEACNGHLVVAASAELCKRRKALQGK